MKFILTITLSISFALLPIASYASLGPGKLQISFWGYILMWSIPVFFTISLICLFLWLIYRNRIRTTANQTPPAMIIKRKIFKISFFTLLIISISIFIFMITELGVSEYFCYLKGNNISMGGCTNTSDKYDNIIAIQNKYGNLVTKITDTTGLFYVEPVWEIREKGIITYIYSSGSGYYYLINSINISEDEINKIKALFDPLIKHGNYRCPTSEKKLLLIPMANAIKVDTSFSPTCSYNEVELKINIKDCLLTNLCYGINWNNKKNQEFDLINQFVSSINTIFFRYDLPQIGETNNQEQDIFSSI